MNKIKTSDIFNYINDLEKENMYLNNEIKLLKNENKIKSKDDFEFKERYDKILNALKELISRDVFMYNISNYEELSYEKYLKRVIELNIDRVPSNLSKEDMYYISFGIFLNEYNEYWIKKRKEEKEEQEEN